MRLLLIRHGQSVGNVDYKKYVELGDCNVGLTDTGWEQAINAGEFLHSHFIKNDINEWPRIYVSSYLRPKQTLSGVLHGLDGTFDGEPNLHEDARLIEHFFGAATRLEHPEGIMDWRVAADLKRLGSHVYAKDKFMTRNLLGESRMDTYSRIRSFAEGTLTMRAHDFGEDIAVVVAHGAVIREFMRFYGDLTADAQLDVCNNCDVIEIIGEPGNCTITKVYDGAAMEPRSELYVDHLKPFGLDDLPEIPDHILDKFPS